jgi:hypothetical protein
MKKVTGDAVEYGIVEFYSPDGWTGFIEPWSDEMTDAEAIDSLRWQLTEMLKALDKPILENPPKSSTNPRVVNEDPTGAANYGQLQTGCRKSTELDPKRGRHA